jgi:hypothetical protein
LRVALVVALLRVDLRVAAAELVLAVLGRRLAADFLVALRRVAEADFLPPAERFAFPRLVIVLPRLAAFFEVFLRLGHFTVVPVTASAMALAALDIPSVTASMLVLAASANPQTAFFLLLVHAVHLPLCEFS